jgi:hypothetical protein
MQCKKFKLSPPRAVQKEKGATTAGDVGPELKSGVGTRLAAINTEQVRRQSEEESGASQTKLQHQLN